MVKKRMTQSRTPFEHYEDSGKSQVIITAHWTGRETQRERSRQNESGGEIKLMMNKQVTATELLRDVTSGRYSEETELKYTCEVFLCVLRHSVRY